MQPTLEEIAGELFEPSDKDLKICMSAILPVVRKLRKQGIPVSAVVAALSRASIATIEQKRP
jgi:hypothetical protein